MLLDLQSLHQLKCCHLCHRMSFIFAQLHSINPPNGITELFWRREIIVAQTREQEESRTMSERRLVECSLRLMIPSPSWCLLRRLEKVLSSLSTFGPESTLASSFQNGSLWDRRRDHTEAAAARGKKGGFSLMTPKMPTEIQQVTPPFDLVVQHKPTTPFPEFLL